MSGFLAVRQVRILDIGVGKSGKSQEIEQFSVKVRKNWLFWEPSLLMANFVFKAPNFQKFQPATVIFCVLCPVFAKILAFGQIRPYNSEFLCIMPSFCKNYGLRPDSTIRQRIFVYYAKFLQKFCFQFPPCNSYCFEYYAQFSQKFRISASKK